jgi:predicted transposase YbfD/YdcC
MSSLSKCLKKLNLDRHQAAILRGSVKDYLQDGYAAHESATKAVNDHIQELEATRADIVAQVNKALGTETSKAKPESELDKALRSVGLDPNSPPDKAKDLRRQADMLTKESMKMLEGIQPGQPVTSTRDRNLREKSAEKMRKASDLIRQAEALEAANKLSTPEKLAVAGKQEPATKETKSPSVFPEYDAHAVIMKRLYDGNVTADDIKSHFKVLQENKTPITEQLGKFTKEKLLSMLGDRDAQRSKNENKAYVVNHVYDSMLDDMNLGRPLSFMMGRDSYKGSLAKAVNSITQDDVKAFSDRIAENRAEHSARQAQAAEAIKEPKTLEDFVIYLRAKLADGMTVTEGRMTLAPDQRARYDELSAEKSRGERSAMEDLRKTDVRVAAQTAEGQIVETKHTKTGIPLFVVKAAERVERKVYAQWNATAKRLGGYYSSFRGAGAVPGFQFKTRENADAFLKFIGGDITGAQEAAKTTRDAFKEDRSQSAVERLTEMADRLEGRADESLGQERKTNTARRAGIAAGMEAAAESEKALAKTMRNIANAIDSGKAKFLNRVRTKSQIEMLRSWVRVSKFKEMQAKYPDGYEREKHAGEPATGETIDYVDFPRYTAFRSDLARLGRELEQIDGTKKLGSGILKVADDVTDTYLKFAKENLHKVSTFGRSDGKPAIFSSRADAEAAIKRSGFKGKAVVLPFKRNQNIIIQSPTFAQENGIWEGDPDKRITLSAETGAEIVAKVKAMGARNRVSMPYIFGNVAEERARLKSMGIETAPELRAALREFIRLQEAPREADKVKAMERAMIGRRKDGLDFFPTPESTVQDMLDSAEIQEGMSVLEPSAGMGHIAEKIRDAGVDPDVVEMSGDRRALLEAKGFNVIGSDFMDINPRDFFTYGDTFKAPDGEEGIMRGSGGLGSGRVGLVDAEGNRIGWFNRDELTGVGKNGVDSGYDRILMNPPFSDRRDAQHVQHAYTLLRPGGRLVAVMGEGVFFGQDKKAQAFRDWLESVGGTSEKLDEGTFLDPSLPVNTGVNARMVVIDRPLRESSSSQGGVQGGNAVTEFFGDTADASSGGEQTINAREVENKLSLAVVNLYSALTKRLDDGVSGNSKPSPNLSATDSFADEIRSFLNVPSRLPGRINTAISEAARNGTSIDADFFGDAIQGQSIRANGFDSLDVESKRLVQTNVLSSIHDSKILNAIIELIPVDVMHDLIGKQLSSNSSLNDKTMLRNAILASRDMPVLFGRFVNSIAASTPLGMAISVAEKVGLLGDDMNVSLHRISAGTAKHYGHDFLRGTNDGDYTKNARMVVIDKPSEAEILLSRAEETTRQPGQDSAPTFYSQLERAIQSSKQGAMPAKQWALWLKANHSKLGVKIDEIDAVGVNEWLDLQQGKVTKDAVLEFVKQNGVQVKEVTLGGKSDKTLYVGGDSWGETSPMSYDAWEKEIPESESDARKTGFYDWYLSSDDLENGSATWEQYRDGLLDQLEVSESQDTTKFSSYQLPGGENYKEIFLTAPVLSAEKEWQDAVAAIKRNDNLGYDYASEALRDVENEGDDWTKAWPDVDVNDIPIIQRYVNAVKRTRTWRDGHSQYVDIVNPIVRIRMNERTDAEGKRTLFLEEVQGPSKENEAKMPPWSNVENRTLQAMKFAIRYAAENGFDRIAWTTGTQQADRYDLSRVLSKVHWYENEDGSIKIEGDQKDGGIALDWIGQPEKMDDVIGKEAADKIRQHHGERALESDEVEYKRAGELAGLDLKVGSTGMVAFYDQMLPNIINKYVKKWGGKVGETIIGEKFAIEGESETPSGKPSHVVDLDADEEGRRVLGRRYTIELEGGERWGAFDDAAQADRNLTRLKAGFKVEKTAAHSLDITPAMRDAVMQGQPMFARDKRILSATKGMQVAAVRQITDQIAAKWTNAPKVNVVQSVSQLPDYLVRALQAVGGENDTRGFFDPQTNHVWMIADHIKSPQIARTVLFHEALGHYGLREMFGKELNPLLNQVYMTYGKIGLSDIARRYGLDLTREKDRLVAAEEMLAHIAETGEKPSLFARLAQFIRDWLRRHGFTIAMTDADVRSAVAQAGKAVEIGLPSRNAIDGGQLAMSKFSNPDTEERYQAARKGMAGVQATVTERFKEWLAYNAHGFTRHHIDLPKTAKFAKAEEALRQFEAAPEAAKTKAVAMLNQILKGMTGEEYDTFTRKVILDDLAHEASIGHALPFGFTDSLLKSDRIDVNTAIQASPKLLKALALRKTYIDRITSQLVDKGILTKEQVNNPAYFRHQVLAYARERAAFTQGTGSKLKKPRPGYAKARHGSLEDINANYIEAEFEFLHRAMIDIKAKETIDKIQIGYDIKADVVKEAATQNQQIRADARRLNKTVDSKDLVKWRDLVPEGYQIWQPEKGNLFFTGKTIGEHAIDGLLDKLYEPQTVIPGFEDNKTAIQEAIDSIRNAVIMGGKKQELVLPQEIAKTLDKMRPESEKGIFQHVFGTPLALWKQWVLINPRRVLRYNLNNLSGDLDAIIAGSPAVVKKLPQAISELWGAMRHTTMPSGNYWDALDRGVFGSGLTMQEIPEINKLSQFKDLVKAPNKAFTALTVPMKAWRTLKDYTQFRENWLRYAAYLHYLEQLKLGKSMKEIGYGASSPKVVEAMTDMRDKAAMLARDLVGDYGSISFFGQSIRRYAIPFYSWMEINTKRYINLINNAFGQGIGKGLATTGAIGALTGARLSAYLLVRMSLMYMLVQLFNNLVHPDEEAELDEAARLRLHLNLGRDENGDVRTLRFQGALSDFLGWFGGEDVASALMAIERGEKTLLDLVKIVAKAPVNKVASGITPLIKTPVELAAGKTFYPDIFNPRSIQDRGRYMARLFSMESEYDQAVGNPTRGYFRNPVNLVVDRRNVGEIAYYRVLDKQREFMDKKGIEGGSDFSTPKSRLIHQLMLAKKYKDVEAETRIREALTEMGVHYSSINTAIMNAKPLARMSIKDRNKFRADLIPEDRAVLEKATEYWRETYRTSE